MQRMPSLFIGHGSPMNALMKTPFSDDISRKAREIPAPSCILVISAHWAGATIPIASSEAPRQIYDFLGFPEALHMVQYAPRGSPETAAKARELLSAAGIPCVLDPQRGTDHAAWTVLLHMYPKADIPVFEIGLSFNLDFSGWFGVGKALSPLRDKGVLIIGSGNIVHNLGDMENEMNAPVADWAIEFGNFVKDAVRKDDREKLLSWARPVGVSRRAVPTPEHYIPLLAVLGTMRQNESARFFHESFQYGSIAMTSLAVS